MKVRIQGAHLRPHLSRFAWQRRLREFYKNKTSLSREVREYRRVGEPYPDALQQFRGLVTTDKGPGRLVGAETSGSRLAPTLRDLAQGGRLSPKVRADLDAFFVWLFSSVIVVGDLHAGNLVYAGDRENRRFVLIDGLGDKTFVPLGAWHAGSRLARKRRIRMEIESELADYSRHEF